VITDDTQKRLTPRRRYRVWRS